MEKTTTRERQGRASTARRVWIAWCLLWAGVWLGAAIYSVILIPFLPLVLLSLLALLLPVGVDRHSASEPGPVPNADSAEPAPRRYALVRRRQTRSR